MPSQLKALFLKTYADADGYDDYMGTWSALLAPPFVEFASLERPRSLLDVGCGTGSLLATAMCRFPDARLVGVDPSAALLNKARRRSELGPVRFGSGTAESLPFETGEFDCCLSLLVLQEFPDPLRCVSEMRRVTRAGGIVAACQWDFARMPIIASLVEAIAFVNQDAGHDLSTATPRPYREESELAGAWTSVGCECVSTARIKVTREYPSLNSLWRPLLSGSTPSTLKLAALPSDQLQAVREIMTEKLASSMCGGCIRITAEALAVRGIA